MDFMKMTIDDIINWCKANGEVAWLKKIAATPIDDRKITFIELKKAFVEKFMPEIAPKSVKKPSMYDRIAALED